MLIPQRVDICNDSVISILSSISTGNVMIFNFPRTETMHMGERYFIKKKWCISHRHINWKNGLYANDKYSKPTNKNNSKSIGLPYVFVTVKICCCWNKNTYRSRDLSIAVKNITLNAESDMNQWVRIYQSKWTQTIWIQRFPW